MKALSCIEEDGVKRVNMANLAIIGKLPVLPWYRYPVAP
jgi:hypothetical protein